MKYISTCIFILFLSFSTAVAQEWIKSFKEAQSLLKQKQYEEAISKTKQHLDEVTQQFGESSKYHSGGYNLLGKIYYLKGDYDNAINSYEKQKNAILNSEGVSHQSYAQALNNISVVYQATGKLDKIEPLLLEAIDAKKKAGNTRDSSYAKYLNNLAQYYYSIGRYPEAEGLYDTSLEIKSDALGSNTFSYGITQYNSALLKKAVGKDEEALELLESSHRILTASGKNSPEAVSAAVQLSLLYMDAGEKGKAEKLMAEAESALSSGASFNTGTAKAMYDIAQAKIKAEDNSGGIKVLNQLAPAIETNLGNAHPLYQKTMNLLGIAHWKSGNIEDAYNYLNNSLVITQMLYGENHIEYAKALQGFAGIIKETGDIDQAAQLYKQSFEIYTDQIQEYFPHYTENEKLRFYSTLKERFEMYNNFVAVNHAAYPDLVSDMYDFHLATKGLVLEYAKGLSDKIIATGDNSLIAKSQIWKELKKQEAFLSGLTLQEVQAKGLDMASIKTQADKLEKELSKAIGENTATKVKWTDIKSILKPDEAAIEIVRFKYFSRGWSDSTFYAAMIIDNSTVTNPKFVLFDDGHRMDGFHYQTYKNMVKSKFPDRKSYKVFWEEIADKIPANINTVYLSLDGVYNNISINSLRKPDGSYVIDDYSIRIIGNTKQLTDSEQRPTLPKQAVLVGNPEYKKSGDGVAIDSRESLDDLLLADNQIIISPLPGTQKEVDLISEKLSGNGWTTNLSMGSSATERTFKNVSNPGLLHIATHGYFLDDIEELEGGKSFGIELDQAYQNPLLRSGLLLAGASDYLNFNGSSYYDDENGILTAYEAVNLDLKDTELVVLSACETGLGKIMNGEGVFGLQRAFQIAGAENIIMSLWTVNDETTQMLMNAFYTEWLSGKDVPTAFRAAQQQIKEEFPAPYYWAPFVLLGKG
jgi:CHAT domain-containing protein